MSDRSFIRFGGLAAVLLAFTSWAAVISYFAASSGTELAGLETYRLLYALVGFWALFAIVSVHWMLRSSAEAWSFFAVLLGVVAAAGTIAASLYQVAALRTALLAHATQAPSASPADPLNVMSFGLTGLWFFIVDLLLWRARYPRLLAGLGFVAAADLFAGFYGALSAQERLVTFASLVAGTVAGPAYWLWLGLIMRRGASQS